MKVGQELLILKCQQLSSWLVCADSPPWPWIGGHIAVGALPQNLWEVGIEKEKSRNVSPGVVLDFVIARRRCMGGMPVTTSESSHAISEFQHFNMNLKAICPHCQLYEDT